MLSGLADGGAVGSGVKRADGEGEDCGRVKKEAGWELADGAEGGGAG